SSAYLALAIVLLSLVVAFGRLVTLLHISSPAVSFLTLLAFVGSGYALLSYRHALIPLSRTWRVGAAAALVATVGGYLVAMAPPAWLRREWRVSEEEGLRAFMESLLVSDETAATDRGALEWAMRLTGGGGAISFDSRGDTRASSGVDPDFAEELQELLPNLANGIRRYERRSGQTVTLIALPIHSIEGIGRLVVVSGPFTPAIGNDEMNRVQQ